MTTPPIGEALRLIIVGARKATSPQFGLSQTDRTLAAATLIGIAIAVAWPRDRVPEFATKAGRIGQQVWDRRSWWVG